MSVKRKRPFGLVAIIILQLLQVSIWGAFLYLLSVPEFADIAKQFTAISPISYNIQLGLMLLLIIALPGLWFLKRWGWILLMIHMGISLSTGIWQFIDGEPDYIGMIFDVAIVFYLNQRDVQLLFEPEIVEQKRAQK